MSAPHQADPSRAGLIAELERSAAFRPWTPAAIASTLALPTTRAWIVGQPARGYLIASSVLDEGEVLTMGVHPGARRQGLGAALLDALHTRWREEGVQYGFLEVRANNPAARGLYESRGWREHGRRVGYYTDGEDALLMRWSP